MVDDDFVFEDLYLLGYYHHNHLLIAVTKQHTHTPLCSLPLKRSFSKVILKCFCSSNFKVLQQEL